MKLSNFVVLIKTSGGPNQPLSLIILYMTLNSLGKNLIKEDKETPVRINSDKSVIRQLLCFNSGINDYFGFAIALILP